MRVEAAVEAVVAFVLDRLPTFHQILSSGSDGVRFRGGQVEEARDSVTGDVFGFVLAAVGEDEDASPQYNHHAYDHTRFAGYPEGVPSVRDALT